MADRAESADSTEGRAATAARILAALGGRENLTAVEGCITRLRTRVKDASLVDDTRLRAAGAHGVVRMGTTIQVVIGTEAEPLAEDIGRIL
jgi:PTS system N-acetylglucosamine-specific IIB component